jgi:hypothetical protein
MHMNHTLNRIMVAATLTGGVAVSGLWLASDSAQAEPGPSPVVWHLDPGDPPPPPPTPPPPPPTPAVGGPGFTAPGPPPHP